jgi:hypothetical protein
MRIGKIWVLPSMAAIHCLSVLTGQVWLRIWQWRPTSIQRGCGHILQVLRRRIHMAGTLSLADTLPINIPGSDTCSNTECGGAVVRPKVKVNTDTFFTMPIQCLHMQ